MFPDNSGRFCQWTRVVQSTYSLLFDLGHYIENTSDTEKLVWIELYKSDRVVDVSLSQWLALTPPDIVASTLKIPLSVVKQLKKEKQVLIAGKA